RIPSREEDSIMSRYHLASAAVLFVATAGLVHAQPDAEGQPLASNARRLLKALEFLGAPVPEEFLAAIDKAAAKQDAEELQKLLDPHVLFHVHLNPEARVKVKRGAGQAVLQHGGYVPVIIKVHNDSTV